MTKENALQRFSDLIEWFGWLGFFFLLFLLFVAFFYREYKNAVEVDCFGNIVNRKKGGEVE